MQAWRIEHVRSGCGPFNHDTDSLAGQEAREIAYSAGMPGPYEREALRVWAELPQAVKHEYVFGFVTRGHLRRYFTPEMTKALRLLGYEVTVWALEGHVYTDGEQVTFRKAEARKLTTAAKLAKAARRQSTRRPRPATTRGEA